MNPFLDACGATGPLLLTVEAPGAAGGETRAFDQPFVLVGRDPRCDLRLDHPEVGDRHAYLQVVGGRLVGVDLGGRAGLIPAGARRRLVDLLPGQSVRVGPFRLQVRGGTDPDRLPDNAPALCPRLELAHRALRRSSCPLAPGLSLVGSGADCPVRLVDPSVSAYHASLVLTPRGLWVVDLLGPGGVRVNGHEVGFARLLHGDTVEVGHSHFRLADAAGPEADAAAEAAAPTPAPRLWLDPALSPTPAGLALTRAPVAPPNDAPGATAPALAQAAEIVERVLAPVVGQVGLIRQQILDEFHQARAAMFETFAALHQEQSAFLTRELEQLRALSQELQALRADLERQTAALANRNTVPPTHAPAVPASAPSKPGAAVRPAALPNGPVGFRTAPAHGPDPAPARPAVPAPPRGPEEDVHARLCDRIARVSREHESRWQKLLRLLPAPLPGRPTA